MSDHYETLGVQRDATPDEIKRAYLKRIKETHPDRNVGSEEEAARINAAYDTLGDSQTRAQYDERNPTKKDQANERLVRLFDSYLEAEHEVTYNLVEKFRQTVLEANNTLAKKRINYEHKIKRLERTKNRLKGGTDLFRKMALEKIGQYTRTVEEINEEIEINKMVVDLIAEYTDEPPVPSPTISVNYPWNSTSL